MHQYRKIWGLKYLQSKVFPVVPYVVINLNNSIKNFDKYIYESVETIGIPKIKNDRIGVTIRVSLPGKLDKRGKHGGLHVMNINEVIRRILKIHDIYKPEEKIIIQHTVDARCSGTLLSENYCLITEAITGDAPPLLEERITNYESWEFTNTWKCVKPYLINQKRIKILSQNNLNNFIGYFHNIEDNSYLEWSISKNERLFFYEYRRIYSGG